MKKIAMTCGVFDLFHSGHKDLLELMRRKAQKTVVFLHDDLSTYENKEKFPVQSFDHRCENLKNTGLVDEIIMVCDKNPGRQFKSYITGKNTFDLIFIRGDDWKDAPGLSVMEFDGVEILFKKYTEGISSTQLRDKL